MIILTLCFVLLHGYSTNWLIAFFILSECSALSQILHSRKSLNKITPNSETGTNPPLKFNNLARICRIFCKLVFVGSYVTFETFTSLKKYKYVSLTPLTLYYLVRALIYIMMVQIKYMYHIHIKLIKFTKFMFCIQLQLFFRAQYSEDVENTTSYLLPAYIYLLVIAPICILILFYSIISRLWSLCRKKKREYAKKYLKGHIWMMTVFFVIIISTLMFIWYLGGRQDKDLQESMVGNTFTSKTVNENYRIINLLYSDLVILMLLLAVGMKIKKSITVLLLEKVEATYDNTLRLANSVNSQNGLNFDSSHENSLNEHNASRVNLLDASQL